MADQADCVLILAPTGRDAELAAAVLRREAIDVKVTGSVDSLVDSLSDGAGAVLLAEEALAGSGFAVLSACLAGQPAWSDLPIMVLSSGTRAGGRTSLSLNLAEKLGNVMLLERPLHALTLVSAAQAALRARRRQYQVRDQLLSHERTAAELDSAHRQLRTITDALPSLVAEFDRELRFRFVNAAARQWYGLPQEAVIGRPMHEVVGERRYQAAAPAYVKALSGEEVKFEFSYSLTGQDDLRHALLTLVPKTNGAGVVESVYALATDITERKSAEEKQAFLMAELDHRVKNTLAAVQSVALRTLGPSPEGVTLSGRLDALAKAHGLLSLSRWEGARLRELIEQELAPYRGDDWRRVRIDGPDFLLTPKATQALAMALHELATNAAKYGALSVPEGRLSVRWRVWANGSRLLLSWREQGLSGLERPARKGFGIDLVERSLAYELRAEVQLQFRPEGLHASIELPIAGNAEPPSPGGRLEAKRMPRAPVAENALAGSRILLVEDVHLVAAQVEALLRRAGCEVVGPAPRLQDALSMSEREPLEGAVLDINLAGELVFPAALALRRRNIPFLFLTGYEGAAIVPAALRDVRRLSKPVAEAELLASLAETIAAKSNRA